VSKFTHISDGGHVKMVDVTEKQTSVRSATAKGRVHLQPETLAQVLDFKVAKGNVLETARIAGIMAAKRTGDLIPMCHPLNITHARVDFAPDASSGIIAVTASVRLAGPTGVEMEALAAVAVACLTIYDMCKALDKSIRITDLVLLEKIGGKSGHYRNPDATLYTTGA